MKKVVLALAVAAISSLFAADKVANVSDSSISFRQDINDEQKMQLPEFKWSEDAPGTSTKYERSYENAPPLIPHSMEGLLPITKDNNMCISCHMPELAEGVGATAIPKSHFADFRNDAADLNGTLAEQRFHCDICHVPQAKTDPLVKNNFEADYSRFKDANASSNLLDTLNQGADLAN